VIITIWINDLMLFASSEAMMNHMKESLHTEWEVTNLGEPSKIIGIEITCTKDTISISQQKYIENIL
jgi:hypothetical protein